MILKFAKMDFGINLCAGRTTCLEIQNKEYFTRVVYSLLSEMGEEAEEPYFLIDKTGKSVGVKSKLIVINNLPCIPTADKKIIASICAEVSAEMQQDIASYDEFTELAGKMFAIVRQHAFGLHSDFDFMVEFDEKLLMKCFGFGPNLDGCARLLDNITAFFEMLVDGRCIKPIVFINLKNFLDKNGLEAVFEQAFFNKIPLLLLESSCDLEHYEKEEKVVVDSDFIVFDLRHETG